MIFHDEYTIAMGDSFSLRAVTDQTQPSVDNLHGSESARVQPHRSTVRLNPDELPMVNQFSVAM